MIKIIKDGVIKHRTACGNCGCLFEFEAQDVTRRTVWDDHGGHYPVCDFYEIECPYCKHTVQINDIPQLQKEAGKMKHIDD